MEQATLDRLNRRLADAFGRILTGEPRYKWAHTSTITLLWRKDTDMKPNASGLYVPDHQYETIRQVDEDYWTVASWQSPPSPDVWVKIYGAGADIAYPQNGMYFVSDVRLPQGVEPNDAYTEEVIGSLRYRNERIRTFRDALQMFKDKVAAREKSQDAILDDWLLDRFTAKFNVPGSRAFHASFPAVQRASGSKESA